MSQLASSSDSRYAKAQRNDPELAAQIAAEASDDDPPWTPPLTDWTLLHELLQVNNDRLGHLAALVADLPIGVKQRHTPPAPLPRPVTEIEKAMKAAREARDRAYDDKILDFAEKAKARWRAQQAAADG